MVPENALAAFERSRRHGCAVLRRMLAAQDGAVITYVALTLPLLVGAAGLAVDVSSWYQTKRTIQAAADAAAYAGALDLARQGVGQSANLTAVQAAANDAASRNGMTAAVTVNIPPTSGLAAGNASSVEVIATETAPLYFASLFVDAAPSISARAVAKAVVSDACIWSLHPSAEGAMTVAGTATVNLACGVVVNSSHENAALEQTGASCLSATSVTVRGGYSGRCVTPDPEVHAPAYGDPLSSLQAPTVGATCDYPNKVTVEGNPSSPPASLSPGVYCGGIEVKANRTAIFAPGLYVMKGGELYVAGNATVYNTENGGGGVTFFLTGSGSNWARLRIESGAIVTLTPMTTGDLANVLFFQDPSAPTGTTFRLAGAANMKLQGIIYIPKGHVEFTGGSTVNRAKILLVSNTITFTGTAHLDADYAGSLLPEAHFARLVE